MQAYRNISGYPLAMRISRSDRRQVERLLAGILEKLKGPLKGKYYPLNALNSDQVKVLGERNIDVSRPGSHTALSIAGCNRDWPDGRGVYISDSLQFVALVNHSDHLIAVACEHGSGDVIAVFEHWSVAMMLIEGLLNSTPLGFNNHTHRQGVQEGDNAGDVNSLSNAGVSACVMGAFQRSDRLGYIACSPEHLGSSLHTSMTVMIPHLGAVQDSLDTICMSLGIRATSVQPTQCSSSDIFNLNVNNTENMGEGRSKERVDEYQKVNGVLHFQTVESNSNTRNGVTDTSAMRCWYTPPALSTVYEIRNKRCMGRSEVQLTQDVIHGVAVLLKIEKHVEKGFSVDDFLSKHPLLLSPILPTSRSYFSIHDMLQM